MQHGGGGRITTPTPTQQHVVTSSHLTEQGSTAGRQVRADPILFVYLVAFIVETNPHLKNLASTSLGVS